MSGTNGTELYDNALLYDIAYDWDVTQEICFFLECMRVYGNIEPRNLLEPACGTGRNMIALANLGISSSGYDINKGALKLAEKYFSDMELEDLCSLSNGDMADFKDNKTFDGAFVSINSFRYLLNDEDILSHLNNTASMLKDGSVYLIDLSYAMPPRQKPRTYEWSANRNGLEIEVCWETEEDRIKLISNEICTLTVNEKNKQTRKIVTRHSTRLWKQQDFLDLLKQSKFRLEAIYNNQFKLIDSEFRLDGNMDNLYHVLKKI
jgi:cyclopropane fatty-acyl-phospholipid synthase-like methyltransferase